MPEPVRDPVCGMRVMPDPVSTFYLGMQFAFCSEQCRERFLSNPRLYAGSPGRPAPKWAGRVVIKRRRLRTGAPLPPGVADAVTADLGAMIGVRDVRVQGADIQITYDLLQITADQIETELGRIGVRLGQGWSARLRRAFVHYLEETELGNLEYGRAGE